MSKWEDGIKAAISILKAFKSGDITFRELCRRLDGSPLDQDASDIASEIGGAPTRFDEYLSFLESMPTEEAYNAWMGD